MFQKDLFKDHVALVTGGRSGIGFAIAKQLLQLGARVMLASRKEDPLREAAQTLQQFGACDHLKCDIRKTEDLQALARRIQEKWGKLDILVNNAGGQFPMLAEHLNDKGWNAVINNNLNGTFYTTREMANAFFIPQKKGIIVNIIVDIFRGVPGMIHTGAARAGVDNITKTLALEWADYNIRINAVAPGIIESSGLDTYPKPIQDMYEDAKKAIPAKRFGTVEEVAHTVCFLASPMAAYINGISLYVDGAAHLNFDKMVLVNMARGGVGKA